MAEAAQLLVAVVRWDASRGYDGERAAIDRAIAAGVGGFVVYGGTDMAVRALTADLRRRSKVPLLIGAELERGAGEQFAGATALPPLAAIAALGDRDSVRRAARITAREARSFGINWCLAPVCDAGMPSAVAACAEWVDACQAEGVLACAKDFFPRPRAPADSQLDLLAGDAERPPPADLTPLGAAIDAGVASVMMTDSVLYRLLSIFQLREGFEFEGLVVANSRSSAERDISPVNVLRAGADLMIVDADIAPIVRSIEAAVSDGVLHPEALRASRERRTKWASWASPAAGRVEIDDGDREWAVALARRCAG